MPKKFRCDLVTWEHARQLSEQLAEMIADQGFGPDIIVALARGGLVPAMNLSDFLGIKDLVSIRVEHWGITATRDKRAKIKHGINAGLEGRKVLMVDDIADTGDSLRVSRDYLDDLNPCEIKIAALHYVNTSKVKPDFYTEVVDRSKQWVWVIYPWNFVEDVSNLIERLGKKLFIKKFYQKDADEIRKGLEEEYKLSLDIREIEKVLCWMNNKKRN